eukprot:s2382_g15.t1
MVSRLIFLRDNRNFFNIIVAPPLIAKTLSLSPIARDSVPVALRSGTACMLIPHVELFDFEAWRLETRTFVLCGRRGPYGIGLGLLTRLGPLGVALGEMDLRSVWQARRLEIQTFLLRGRRSAYGVGLGLLTRLGVALGDTDFRFVWHAWHLWRWAGSADALGSAWSPVTPRRFAWQAWRLVTSMYFSLGCKLRFVRSLDYRAPSDLRERCTPMQEAQEQSEHLRQAAATFADRVAEWTLQLCDAERVHFLSLATGLKAHVNKT